MIRFLFRVLAVLTLAGATIMAVLDATRTVANASLVLTPLGESWNAAFPAALASLQALLDSRAPWLWDPAFVTMLQLPGFLVLAVLAFLLYAIGHRPAHLRDDWA